MAKQTCVLATCSGERHTILNVRCVMFVYRDLLAGDGSAAAAAANADLECACESVVSSVIAMLPPR